MWCWKGVFGRARNAPIIERRRKCLVLAWSCGIVTWNVTHYGQGSRNAMPICHPAHLWEQKNTLTCGGVGFNLQRQTNFRHRVPRRLVNHEANSNPCPHGRRPNPYEDPRGQETNAPSKRIVPIFFRCPSGRAPSIPGHVCCLHGRLLVHQRGSTTHVGRFSRRGDDACRDDAGWSRRPRNFSGPSYRPRQRGG